jgi:hypothetical protein
MNTARLLPPRLPGNRLLPGRKLPAAPLPHRPLPTHPDEHWQFPPRRSRPPSLFQLSLPGIASGR